MKAGSTVDDPEVAAMVASGLTGFIKGPFYSGGGFSNIFPSDYIIPTRTLTRSTT